MYYSSWWKLKVAVSWLLHYKRYLKNKILQRRESSLTKQGLEERRGHLTLDEFLEAEHEILGCIQTREVIAPQSEEDPRLVKEANEENGSFNKQVKPLSPMGIVASRRPYWTRPFVLWPEAPRNLALQA